MSLRRLPRAPSISLRPFSTTSRRIQRPIPYTPTCPSPTCACTPTPDLDIDRKMPLLHTTAPYSEHVVLCTGKSDWASRIEDEETPSGEFVRGLKGVIGRGGTHFDVCLFPFRQYDCTRRNKEKKANETLFENQPFTNILITASSFPADNTSTPPTQTPPSSTPSTTTALLFPSFQLLPNIPHTPTAYTNLAKAYLSPRTLHPSHASLPTPQKTHLTRDPTLAAHLPAPRPITTPTILICSHTTRDTRCGTLAPLLASAFTTHLARAGVSASVGLISHIGGHKFAGNVIVYLPPGRGGNALAGMGIWYGRVRVEEVEGVVGETIVGGKVVGSLLRGGVTGEGGDVARLVEEQLREGGG